MRLIRSGFAEIEIELVFILISYYFFKFNKLPKNTLIMEYFKHFLQLGFLLLVLSCTRDKNNLHSNTQLLWSEQAAYVWEEALPIGNGR